ncbi:Interactor of constitutive active ROPs 3 [Linum perenne]
MQPAKASRSSGSSSEAPQKVSPRAARQLKTSGFEADSPSPSSTHQLRTPKNRSPKVSLPDRKSPLSPASERKRPSKISELETQISQLHEELKRVRAQLCTTETSKKQALEDAEESKKQFIAASSKLQESQKLLQELSCASGAGISITELQQISEEKDQAWQSELDATKQKHLLDSAALESALGEVQQLKLQLDMVAESSAEEELQVVKGKLMETVYLVETMTNQLQNSKESEAEAHAVASETLMQLEAAKKTVETMRLDGVKSADAYNSLANELDQSRARVSFLEGLVSKFETNDVDDVAEEVVALRAEVSRLRTELEAVEGKTSSAREAELEAELKRAKAGIEELKAELMDKETELQGISEENEGLNIKLSKTNASSHNESSLRSLEETVGELKEKLMDKETEVQKIVEENRRLKIANGEEVNEVKRELEAARGSEREAVMKLGMMSEEAEKSRKKEGRVREQLDAAEAVNSEMEAEMRRLKVQSDQWRKAAEAAAAMLSGAGGGNNNNGKRFVERTGSLDSNYGKMGSPYGEEIDEDDMLKKKNGNVLKKIGVLWKKQK